MGGKCEHSQRRETAERVHHRTQIAGPSSSGLPVRLPWYQTSTRTHTYTHGPRFHVSVVERTWPVGGFHSPRLCMKERICTQQEAGRGRWRWRGVCEVRQWAQGSRSRMSCGRGKRRGNCRDGEGVERFRDETQATAPAPSAHAHVSRAPSASSHPTPPTWYAPSFLGTMPFSVMMPSIRLPGGKEEGVLRS